MQGIFRCGWIRRNRGFICAAMTDAQYIGLPFMKMHGLGNDFVVVDARARSVAITPALAQAVGDRHRGIGFDQLAVIRQGADGVDAHLEFWNSDGTQAGACGNATRCIARFLLNETGRDRLHLTTARGTSMPSMRATG